MSKGKQRSTRSTRNSGRGATRKVQRQPRQRRNWSFSWLNRLLILLGTGAVLAAGLQGFITLQAIPVEQITVTGNLKHTQTEAVQEMVQPALAGGFLNADLEQIQAQLEVLPWIYQASVRRRWPHSLEINVVEQLPIARWGEGGFLNHEGAVFEPADADAWQSLPRLVGPPGSEDELMVRYQRLEELLEEVALEVQTLELDARGHMRAQLANGITLVLGGDNVLERVRRFIAVYRADLAPRASEVARGASEVARVDLRYESGLAVAFHEVDEEQEPARQVAGLASE